MKQSTILHGHGFLLQQSDLCYADTDLKPQLLPVLSSSQAGLSLCPKEVDNLWLRGHIDFLKFDRGARPVPEMAAVGYCSAASGQ